MLRISPLRKRRIQYVLDFTADDGRRLHFEGQKTINYLAPLRTFTTLPGRVTEEAAAGRLVGEALLFFDARRDLLAFLRGFRLERPLRPALSNG